MILFFFDIVNVCFFFEEAVFDFLRLLAMNENKRLSYKFTLPSRVGNDLWEDFWYVNNTSHKYRNKGYHHYRSSRNVFDPTYFSIKFRMYKIGQFFHCRIDSFHPHHHTDTDALKGPFRI